MGGIDWQFDGMNEYVHNFTKVKMGEFGERADAKGVKTEMEGMSMVAPDPEAMIREYGTATEMPDPWGITTLMEMQQ